MFTTRAVPVLRQLRHTPPSFGPLNPAQASSFRRFVSSLALLEQRDGKLNESSLAAVSAAQKLGGSITGFLAGEDVPVSEAAKIKGLNNVVFVKNEAYNKVSVIGCAEGYTHSVFDVANQIHEAQTLPENYAPLLVENIRKGGYTHVFAGHTAFGKTVMPRLAALMDSQQVSDIIGIEGEDGEHKKLTASKQD